MQFLKLTVTFSLLVVSSFSIHSIANQTLGAPPQPLPPKPPGLGSNIQLPQNLVPPAKPIYPDLEAFDEFDDTKSPAAEHERGRTKNSSPSSNPNLQLSGAQRQPEHRRGTSKLNYEKDSRSSTSNPDGHTSSRASTSYAPATRSRSSAVMSKPKQGNSSGNWRSRSSCDERGGRRHHAKEQQNMPKFIQIGSKQISEECYNHFESIAKEKPAVLLYHLLKQFVVNSNFEQYPDSWWANATLDANMEHKNIIPLSISRPVIGYIWNIDRYRKYKETFPKFQGRITNSFYQLISRKP